MNDLYKRKGTNLQTSSKLKIAIKQHVENYESHQNMMKKPIIILIIGSTKIQTTTTLFEERINHVHN